MLNSYKIKSMIIKLFERVNKYTNYRRNKNKIFNLQLPKN